jgi:hypothetical protein
MSSQSLSDIARFMPRVVGGVHVLLLLDDELLLLIGVDVKGVVKAVVDGDE